MIGLFDSGVGGLSILREIQRLLPNENFVFFGDTAHIPYGEKSSPQIQTYALAAVDFLQNFHPDLIVVACNTATAVAIDEIRRHHPQTPIVGVVPVVKTITEQTKTERVAVCATSATLKSPTYTQLKHDFASTVIFLELAMPEWVAMVETGDIQQAVVRQSVEDVAKKVADFGADVLALGSTHFPFLRSVIETAMPNVRVFDSGPAVARQVARILATNRGSIQFNASGKKKYYCSGDPKEFSRVASALLGTPIEARQSGQAA